MSAIRVLVLVLIVFCAAATHAQDCGTGPAPACDGSCPTDSVCRPDTSGVPGCVCVATQALGVKKLSIKLSFAAAGSDSIKLKGTLPVPDSFAVGGARVIVDVGGVIKSFTLDDKGKAAAGDDKIKLAVRAKGGVVLAQDAALSAKFKKGSFADELADEGLTNATISDLPVTVSVQVDVGPVVYSSSPTLTYTAKAGKSGKAK